MGSPDRMAAAREAKWEQAAERRALTDPVHLRWSCRVYRAAVRLGLADRDGNVLDPEQARRDRAAEAVS